MKKGKEFLFLLILLFFMGFAVAVVNLFVAQNPSDIDTFNLFGTSVSVPVNITYNISDVNLNLSTIFLYYKTNSTSTEDVYFVNGSATSGFSSVAYTSNASEIFLFQLFDNQVYPARYNLNERGMETTSHLAYDLDDSDVYLKIRFLNVSNQKNFSFFEIYADNQTTTSLSLRMYYCNSSYVGNVNPLTSSFCTNFYNLLASEIFNHTHSAFSRHHVVPLSINSTTGMVGNVYVTNTSYILLRGRDTVNAWNIYYISNISRTDTIQEDTNGGVGATWANFSGTIDSHLHQYDGTDSLWYYACANDTLGSQNCTSLRQDLIELGELPPSSANVFAPANQSYKGNIFINYTAAESPNAYAITGYNISIYNYTDVFVLSLENDSTDLNLILNSSAVSDGVYNIHVRGCDVNGLCSTGESDDFIIDNTNPSANSSCDSATVFVNDVLTCSCAASDATSGINTTIYTTNPFTGDSGTYVTSCSVTDNAGNSVGSSFSYEVVRHSQSGGGGGSGSSSTVKPTNNTIISSENENISVSENQIVEVPVENQIYLINVSEVENNSVKIIFSYDNSEKQISVGEKVNYEIGENIITINLEGIENGEAIFNVAVNKKIPVNNDFLIILGGLFVFGLFIFLIRKNISKLFFNIREGIKKLFRHKRKYSNKTAELKISKKIREADRLKKKAEKLIKEAERAKKENFAEKRALVKLKKANLFTEKSRKLTEEAHRICKNCNISYHKFKLN